MLKMQFNFECPAIELLGTVQPSHRQKIRQLIITHCPLSFSHVRNFHLPNVRQPSPKTKSKNYSPAYRLSPLDSSSFKNLFLRLSEQISFEFSRRTAGGVFRPFFVVLSNVGSNKFMFCSKLTTSVTDVQLHKVRGDVNIRCRRRSALQTTNINASAGLFESSKSLLYLADRFEPKISSASGVPFIGLFRLSGFLLIMLRGRCICKSRLKLSIAFKRDSD